MYIFRPWTNHVTEFTAVKMTNGYIWHSKDIFWSTQDFYGPQGIWELHSSLQSNFYKCSLTCHLSRINQIGKYSNQKVMISNGDKKHWKPQQTLSLSFPQFLIARTWLHFTETLKTKPKGKYNPIEVELESKYLPQINTNTNIDTNNNTNIDTNTNTTVYFCCSKGKLCVAETRLKRRKCHLH